ncbi:hypothetical protein [Zoogloea sp.]|uniref:hypothetical protein n=1 Tax=Zoogloea sp. TaxID=49181 RepID=UPI0025F01355|nr:hypothetical protein [Zoogloea sp.]MCK6393898.1 hypothetical protein [Zoogloea sp.]
MHDPSPALRDHLFDPSGGLIYQLRALRYRRTLWAGFHAAVADWLNGWQPGCPSLVIIGPNAGHALPAGFLARFEQIVALEPDPLARHLLARRADAGGLRFERLDCLATSDGLARLAARFPDAAFLFSNVLGQVAAPGGSWSSLLVRHLRERPWASYHDVVSTTRAAVHQVPLQSAAALDLEALLAHFWGRGEITVTDHETLHLGGRGPCGYAVWPITPAHWHLVEWVVNQA